MYKISKNKLSVAMLNAGVKCTRDLAALAGISVNTLSRINNGGRATLPTVRALATALDVVRYIRRLIATETVPHVDAGRKKLVNVDQLLKFLEGESA